MRVTEEVNDEVGKKERKDSRKHKLHEVKIQKAGKARSK